jgi:short-subunit dehydrogenase
MKTFSNRVVVITGASSGIGRCTALDVARNQGTVVLASRQEKALKELAYECESLGGSALVVPTDVTDEKAVQRLARKAYHRFGRIDCWVNNAAVTLFAKFEEAPADAYRKVIETNLFGYIHGARAVLPYFREQGQGVMINVSSMVGKVGSPYVSAYTTSKFAITGWAESLRMELEDAPGIHVCTVLPASIDTPLFQHAANYSGRAVKPIPPVYTAEMVAQAILGCMVHPQREIFVGKSGAGLAGLRTLAPALAERMMAKQVDQEHFKEQFEEPKQGNVFAPMKSHNSVDGGWEGREPGSAVPMAVAFATLAAGVGAVALYFRGSQQAVIGKARRISRTPKSPIRAGRKKLMKVAGGR